MADSKRDSNRVTTLLAVQSDDLITPILLAADPLTNRLLVNAVISGSLTTSGVIVDGVSSTIKATVADLPDSNPLATMIVDANGDQIVSFGGGTEYTDGGTPPTHPVGGVLIYDNAGTWASVSNTNKLPVNTGLTQPTTPTDTQPISATALPLPALAATSTKQSDGSQKTQIVDSGGNIIGATSNALNVHLDSGVTVLSGNFTDASDHAEDDAHVSGDTGSFILGVRNDNLGTTFTNTDGDYSPIAVNSKGVLRVDPSGTTAQPTTIIDGGDVTLGAKADARSTATDTTAVTIMSVLKEISFMEQNPASRAVTATLAAETTKIIGAINNLPATVDTNSGNKSASTLRVVLATDQPALTNKLLVTPDANSAVNVAQFGGTNVVNGGTAGSQSIGGIVAHDGANTSNNPIVNAMEAIAFGANPTEVAAADVSKQYGIRAGIPFVLPTHMNLAPTETSTSSAQTDVALQTVSSGTKIGVMALHISVDIATTVAVSCRIGFGTASTPTTSGVLFSHPGLAPGFSQFIVMPATVGADGSDLRYTISAATNGAFRVVAYTFTTST